MASGAGGTTDAPGQVMNIKPETHAAAPVRDLAIDDLITVTGGLATPNMGPPKYSAAWWEFVRARGGDQAK